MAYGPLHAQSGQARRSHSRSRVCWRSSWSTPRSAARRRRSQPSNLAGHTGTVSLTGKVTAVVAGTDSHTPAGLQFKLHNINGASPIVPIVFHGSVPGSLQGRPRRERHRPARGRVVRRDRAHDEVPEQVHRLAGLEPVADLGRAALVVSFGLALYALVGGTAAALSRQRRLADSARYALIACFGSTVDRLGRARAGARHARLHAIAYVAAAHEPRPQADLLR